MCQNNTPAPDMTMVVDNNIRVIQRDDVVEAVSLLGVAADHFDQLEALFIAISKLQRNREYGQIFQLLEIGKQLAFDKFIYFEEMMGACADKLHVTDAILHQLQSN